MEEEIHYIKMPLFEVVGNLSHCQFENYHKISCHSLFWSLSRLFDHYYRIVNVWNPYDAGDNHLDSTFLANDIENFVIRLRIMFNEVAFMIRQLYPNQVRGMQSSSGNQKAKIKEFSINELYKFTAKNPEFEPKLTELLNRNKDWLFALRKQRDNIVHYKSQVVVFEPNKPNMTFAIINPGGEYPTIKTPEGGTMLVLTPVFKFINDHMISVLRFLNTDVVEFIMAVITSKGFQYGDVGIPGSTRISCTGVALFNLINNHSRTTEYI